MANVTLWGASYSNVPALTVPKTGGGLVTFYDEVGTKTITSNGTGIDVSGYAAVDVNVSGGGGSSVKIGTASSFAVTNSTLSFPVLGNPTSYVVLATSGISPTDWITIAAVVYDGTTVHGQSITNGTNAVEATPNGELSSSYSGGVLTITTEDTSFSTSMAYKLIYSYDGTSSDIHTADVQVGSGATSITFPSLAGNPVYWSCIFKSNFSTSSGYQRVIAVANDGDDIEGLAMDTSAKAQTSWTASYSGGSLTITSQGTNNGGYFHQPGYYQLTYAVDGSVGPTEIEVEPLSVTQNGTYTAPTGKAYSPVTVNVSGGGTLTVKTATATHTSTTQTLSFSSLSAEPKYWYCRVTSQVSSSGSTTIYYITDLFYDGTNIKGNSFRIGSTRRIYNITSGISQSYSSGTLTITGGSSTGSSPGQFYGASNISYELVYIY